MKRLQNTPLPEPVPASARLLGLAGLLPALAAAVVAGAGSPDWRDPALRVAIAYAAVILSFLGGAWWGLACARAEVRDLTPWLAVSVVPALSAWPLVLLPASIACWAVAMLFATALFVDRQLLRASLAPRWWWSLRWPLSTGMAVLHAALGVLSAT